MYLPHLNLYYDLKKYSSDYGGPIHLLIYFRPPHPPPCK